jgi:hypothetical protein
LFGVRPGGCFFTAEIPGNLHLENAPENNSAKFTGQDLVVNMRQQFILSTVLQPQMMMVISFLMHFVILPGVNRWLWWRCPAAGPPPYGTIPYGQDLQPPHH